MQNLEKLIPPAVTTDAAGERLPYWARRFPRSEAYETAARAVLPAGWELYSVLDGDAHPNLAAKDFGATRLDQRAMVFGIRELGGEPKRLCASIPGGERAAVTKFFEAGQLGEACRWCDEQIGGAS